MLRLSKFHFRAFGLLLVCIGTAGLGAGAVDFYIHWADSQRRPPVTPLTQEDLEKRMAHAREDMQTAYAVAMGRSPLKDSSGVNMDAYRNLKPKTMPVGSLPPDFTLKNAIDQRTVQLGDYRGKKAVVLVFGSFGCDIFCHQLARLNKLHQTFKNRAEFLFVYVKEASHLVSPLPKGPPEEPLAERISRGLRHFHIAFPCLLGTKTIEALYTPFPERLLIIDRTGRIALDAGLGVPGGWDLERVESWLKQN
jgi:Iodothyronine deiodinase